MITRGYGIEGGTGTGENIWYDGVTAQLEGDQMAALEDAVYAAALEDDDVTAAHEPDETAAAEGDEYTAGKEC